MSWIHKNDVALKENNVTRKVCFATFFLQVTQDQSDFLFLSFTSSVLSLIV